jgi:hypothetical protein
MASSTSYLPGASTSPPPFVTRVLDDFAEAAA